MSLCKYCNKCEARKPFKGYCCQSHYRLAKRRPTKLKIPCKGGCGTLLTRNPSAVAPSGNAFCKSCGKNRGELHTKWRDGQYINDNGYRMILKDGTYVREHRAVWERTNRSSLFRGATVHHIDFDKLNNSPENLLLFSSEEHGRFHRWIDSGRYDQAAAILRGAGLRQYHYPRGVDSFIVRLFTSAEAYQADLPPSKPV